MNGFDRHQALALLALLAMTLIISANYPPLARQRRQIQMGAIVLFAAAVVLALVEIALWLAKPAV